LHRHDLRGPEEIEARRKAFIRKWRLRHRAVAEGEDTEAEADVGQPLNMAKSARRDATGLSST
jgi:hypothetical protein